MCAYSAIANLRKRDRNFEVFQPLDIGLSLNHRQVPRVARRVDGRVQHLDADSGRDALRGQPEQAVAGGRRVAVERLPRAHVDGDLVLQDVHAAEPPRRRAGPG